MRLVAILAFVLSFCAQAEQLTELALFYRCYSHLTQSRPALNDTLTMQVINKTKTAIQACTEVLNSVSFNSSGVIATDNERNRIVLNNFHRLHASWFQIKAFAEVGNTRENQGMIETGDTSTPAAYVTRSLFSPTTNYSTIATSTESLRVLRTADNPTQVGNLTKSSFQAVFTNFQFSGRGPIIGVVPSGNPVWNYSAKKNSTGELVTGSYYRHRNYGAGFLGTSDYMLMTVETDKRYNSDGGVKVPRKWARSLLNDLLCRSLPLVRDADVTSFVVPTSTVPFRQSTTCVKCHATMDRMAFTIRGFGYAGVGGTAYTPSTGSLFVNMRSPKSTLASETGWPAVADTNFYLRPPNGVLYYRSYSGNLINQPLSGLQDLGNKLAAQDDMYICLAKRYYEYFTGVSAVIQDPGDPQAEATTDAEDIHRNIVINLGRSLKSHQSPKRLILDILNLPHYRLSDYGVSDSRGLVHE